MYGFTRNPDTGEWEDKVPLEARDGALLVNVAGNFRRNYTDFFFDLGPGEDFLTPLLLPRRGIFNIQYVTQTTSTTNTQASLLVEIAGVVGIITTVTLSSSSPQYRHYNIVADRVGVRTASSLAGRVTGVIRVVD